MVRHDRSNCLPGRGLFSVSSKIQRGGIGLVQGLIAIALLIGSSGCTAVSMGGKAVKELRSENDRLLGEFRAERDRRQQLEKKLNVMEQRLAESEKLLARQYSTSSERVSQLSSGSSTNRYSEPTLGSSRPGSGGLSGRIGTNGDSGLRWQRRTSH